MREIHLLPAHKARAAHTRSPCQIFVIHKGDCCIGFVIAEAAIAGCADAVEFFAPNAKEIIARLNTEAEVCLADPEFKSRLAELGGTALLRASAWHTDYAKARPPIFFSGRILCTPCCNTVLGG
jgi:hypothetical protein